VIIPLAAVVLMLLPALVGGRLSQLALLRLHRASWIGAALLLQVLVFETLDWPHQVLSVAHIGTYAVAAYFLRLNRRVPGMLAIGLGALSNGATITLNGGTLPARLGALKAAGLDVDPEKYVNSGVLAHPRLWFLGDVFAVPAQVPLANVFSIGDVLIVLGAAYASWRICGTWWWRPWKASSYGHSGPRHAAGLPRYAFDL
jgi:Family of unknown function (DUF5317)